MGGLKKAALIALFPLAMGGCATVDGPALLTAPTVESHAELEAVVSKAMDGKKVTLAQNVLTEQPTMVVEQKQYRSISNDPLMGRRMDRPHHFSLNKQSGKCVLTHDESGTTYPLKKANCAAVETE